MHLRVKTRRWLVSNNILTTIRPIPRPYSWHILFVDDLGDARNTITELTRRLHEAEIEIRRLENEREELTAAYKEAEAVSSKTTLKMRHYFD